MIKKNILLIVVIFVVLLILINQIINLKKTILQKQNELNISLKKNEQLSNLVKNEIDTNPKEIRDILKNYLENLEVKDSIKNNISLEKIKNSNWEKRNLSEFIPDNIPIKEEYSISQHFTQLHTGLDFASPHGGAVIAAGSGKVVAKYTDEYFGNILIIDHLNKYATVYAHLAQIFVEENAFVNKGEIIANVGNSGNSSAPHLHFEILVDGKNINPEKVFK